MPLASAEAIVVERLADQLAGPGHRWRLEVDDVQLRVQCQNGYIGMYFSRLLYEDLDLPPGWSTVAEALFHLSLATWGEEVAQLPDDAHIQFRNEVEDIVRSEDLIFCPGRVTRLLSETRLRRIIILQPTAAFTQRLWRARNALLPVGATRPRPYEAKGLHLSIDGPLHPLPVVMPEPPPARPINMTAPPPPAAAAAASAPAAAALPCTFLCCERRAGRSAPAIGGPPAVAMAPANGCSASGCATAPAAAAAAPAPAAPAAASAPAVVALHCCCSAIGGDLAPTGGGSQAGAQGSAHMWERAAPEQNGRCRCVSGSPSAARTHTRSGQSSCVRVQAGWAGPLREVADAENYELVD